MGWLSHVLICLPLPQHAHPKEGQGLALASRQGPDRWVLASHHRAWVLLVGVVGRVPARQLRRETGSRGTSMSPTSPPSPRARQVPLLQV